MSVRNPPCRAGGSRWSRPGARLAGKLDVWTMKELDDVEVHMSR